MRKHTFRLTAAALLICHAAIAGDAHSILLNAGAIDTASPEHASDTTTLAAFSGKKLRLIQFRGPIETEWYANLEKSGARIVCYIPNNAYLVYGDVAALNGVQALAKSSPGVQWSGEYTPAQKVFLRAITPVAAQRIQANCVPPETNLFAIQMVLDAQANPATCTIIENHQLEPLRRKEINEQLGYLNVIATLPENALNAIAAQSDVVSIQRYTPPEKCDERQDQIIAGNLNVAGSQPSGTNYLGWLTSVGFTQAQFTNSGFIVDITDDGWDGGVAATPLNSEFRIENDPAKTSRVKYAIVAPGSVGIPSPNGVDGHGNINVSIVGGYNDGMGNPANVDGSGYHYGLGVCPFATLAATKVFADGGAWGYPNEAQMVSTQYGRGCRVSSDSWGASAAGAYNTDSQNYDTWTRDAQPGVAGNQELLFVFAAGNSGSGAGTVGSPGTAKNVIAVGAAENYDPGYTDGSGIASNQADNANDIVGFSSRGPCDDGRKKPDIVAPGSHIHGAASYDPSYNGSGVSDPYNPAGQTKYAESSGTSHSTPAIAGCAALVRQYFINMTNAPPSPAMSKAFLMNATRYLKGVSANDNLWSNNQGMGEAHLATAFNNQVSRVLRDQLPGDVFTATGQERTFVYNVSASDKPVRITLAWTDAPGSTTGAAYNNNLDLVVTIGGTTYKGNVFSKQNSVTGGSADDKNNVESVFLLPGISGIMSVKVLASNINSDGVPGNADPADQDFALVVYNAKIPALDALTDYATNIVAGSAALIGTVNPQGHPTTYWFNYGLSETYGAATAFSNVGAGISNIQVTTAIAGLTNQTTYHFRIAASNETGVVMGDDKTFATSGSALAPEVSGVMATNITSASAQLAGTINPHGAATTYFCEYGTTTAYAAQTATASAGTGSSNAAVNTTISNLIMSQLYHFRLVASNSAGVTDSGDHAFVTKSDSPATLFLYDGFDYTAGTALDANGWEPAGNSPKILVADGNLAVPALMPPSGNMCRMTNYVAGQGLHMMSKYYDAPQAGYLYHSFAFSIQEISSLFPNASGFTGFYAMGLNTDYTLVGLQPNGSVPANYDIGIAGNKDLSSGAAAWDTNGGNGYIVGTTNFIVLRVACTNISVNTAPAGSYVAWVNPAPATFGGADPGSPTLSSKHRMSSAGGGTQYIYKACYTTRTGAQILADEVRVGTTWADVTPPIPEPIIISLLAVSLAYCRCKIKCVDQSNANT